MTRLLPGLLLTLLLGCQPSSSWEPSSTLINALRQVENPIRFTWYLSPELEKAENLRRIDGQLASLFVAAQGMGTEVHGVVRPPLEGERRPGALLPLPGVDGKGRSILLWSGLVLDSGDSRIVIPDLWEPQWFELDLARALEDLQIGSPLGVSYIDGGSFQEGQNLSLLNGRWRLVNWEPSSGLPSTSVLIVVDGEEFQGSPDILINHLDAYLDQGGRILFIGDSQNGDGLLGTWIQGLRAEESLIYGKASMELRDYDKALLTLTGRDDLLKLLPSSLPVADIRNRPAGWQLLGVAGKPRRDIHIPKSSDVATIDFSIPSVEDPWTEHIVYTLENNGDGWILLSTDQILPARSDRIEGFLGRLMDGAAEVWDVDSPTAEYSQKLEKSLSIDITDTRGRTIHLIPLESRPSGGGVYVEWEKEFVLWPFLVADEIAGDPRYWMERRLFVNLDKPIRGELTTKDRLYWRIHAEGDNWYTTDGRGKRSILEARQAQDYLNRLRRAESLAIRQGGESSPGDLVLTLEDQQGRREEYQLKDLAQGYVTAESKDGIQHLLDHGLAEFILKGL